VRTYPAQVGAQRGHALVAVDQHQRALGGAGRGQGGLDRIGQRRQVTASTTTGDQPAAGHLAEQGALADAARSVDQHHAGRRVIDQQPVDQRQLGDAADEAGPVPPRQTDAERRHGGSLGDPLHPPR
jgi:hypothetical protein